MVCGICLIAPSVQPAWEHPTPLSKARHSHRAQGSNHRLLPTPLPPSACHLGSHIRGTRALSIRRRRGFAPSNPSIRKETEARGGNANAEEGEMNVVSRVHCSRNQFGDSGPGKRPYQVDQPLSTANSASQADSGPDAVSKLLAAPMNP